MELKEFIKSSVSAIAEATLELQDEYSSKGVLVNPPAAKSGSEVYADTKNYSFRRVKDIEFDVAISAGSTNEGKASAGISVLSVEVGASGRREASSETVSRIRFSVPIALRPTNEEGQNLGRKTGGPVQRHVGTMT